MPKHSSEDVLNFECQRLYAALVASMTKFQLGVDFAPRTEDFELWKSMQFRRLQARRTVNDAFGSAQNPARTEKLQAKVPPVIFQM